MLRLILALTLCLSANAADVLRVRATRDTTGHGWCVAVAPDCVLTAAHILHDGKGARDAEVEIGGKWFKATLKKCSRENDLALLKVEGAAMRHAVMSETLKLSLIGSPGLNEVKIRPVSVESVSIKVEYGKSANGMSGSPVFDASGALYGIFTHQLSEDSNAIGGGGEVVPAEVIKAFLK